MGSMTGRSAIATIAITTSMTLLSLSGLQAQGVVPMEPSAQTNASVENSEISSTSPNSLTDDEPGVNPSESIDSDESSSGSETADPKLSESTRESTKESVNEEGSDTDAPQTSVEDLSTQKSDESAVPKKPSSENENPSHSQPLGFSGFRNATNTLPNFSNPYDRRLLPAAYATAGSGRYKENILWLQWKPGNLIDVPGNPRNNPTRLTQHNFTDLSNQVRLVVSCTISNLNYDKNRPEYANRRGPIESYIPGTWHKDSLDDLYKVYAPNQNDPTTPSNRLSPIGIKNKGDERHINGMDYRNTTPTFNLDCEAQLLTKESTDPQAPYTNSVPFGIDGLVVADAESPGFGQGVEEFVEIKTTSNTQWYVLDEIHTGNAWNREPNSYTTQGSTASYGRLSGDLIRILPNGKEEQTPTPGAVLFAQGVSSAQVTIQGNGEEAVAFGVVVPTDFGDAPESYGEALSLYHPTWTSPLTKPSTNLNRHPLSNMGVPEYMLGNAITADKVSKHSERADRDEDDALYRPLRFVVYPGASTNVNIKCTNGGVVAGWIDWNLDGDFDPNEKTQNEVPCRNGIARLTWTVPSDVARVVENEDFIPQNHSFLRLRIVTPTESSLGGGSPIQPTGPTLSGEVEDHAVQVYSPTLRLINKVEDPDSIAQTLRPHSDWAVKAVFQGTPVTSTRTYVGNGSFMENVPIGSFVLSVAGTTADIPEYSHSGWTCRQSEGAINASGQSYASSFDPNQNRLNIPQADHVTCTITHRPIPGELRWQKVDGQNNSLADSQWLLTGPSAPTGKRIKDCKSATCAVAAGELLDTDPRPGYFRINGLKWGSYSLVETHAPPGYVLDSSVQRAEVTGTPVDLGRFVNVMHRPLVIPLTGGTASIFYVLTGGGLVIAAFAGAAAIGSPGRRRGRA